MRINLGSDLSIYISTVRPDLANELYDSYLYETANLFWRLALYGTCKQMYEAVIVDLTSSYI